MRDRTKTFFAFLPGLTLACLVGLIPHAGAQESPIYNVSTADPGGLNQSTLISDSSGNLYGIAPATTVLKGLTQTYIPGTAFELVNSSGAYTLKVLYTFPSFPTKAVGPNPGLVMDSTGNLYGTTGQGVFELVNSSGTYTQKMLYTFAGTPDGEFPVAGLIMDPAGNLYGTTISGGTYNNGTVFELVNSSGSYTEKVLYSFGAATTDALSPQSSLIMDSAGDLFGATSSGGDYQYGAVYELVNSSGTYTEKVLYSFGVGGSSGGDGIYPNGALVIDSAGDLFGLTIGSLASPSTPTVFELVNSSGAYSEQIVYRFAGGTSVPLGPTGGLAIDGAGDLYGTSSRSGSGPGTIYELANSSGAYTVQVLHSFIGGATDGLDPETGLYRDALGNMYGSTVGGGLNSLGTLFKWSACATTTTLTSSPNPAIAGQNIILSAAVATAAPQGCSGAGLSGTVQFFNGSTLLGSASLPGGLERNQSAHLTIEDAEVLGIGTANLTAQYIPNTPYYGPSSGRLLQTVGEPGVATIGSNTFSGNQTITGSLMATSLFGNGAGITSLNPMNLSPGTANINITGNAATATTAATAASADALGSVLAANFARLDIGNSFTGNQSVTGNQTVTGSVAIGGGTPIAEYFSLAPFPITVPALTPGACTTFTTAPLSNFSPGSLDTIAMGISSSLLSGFPLSFQAWETNSSANTTVTIQVCNPTGSKYKGGATGSIRVDIFKH